MQAWMSCKLVHGGLAAGTTKASELGLAEVPNKARVVSDDLKVPWAFMPRPWLPAAATQCTE